MSQMWSSQNRAGEMEPGGTVYGRETGGEEFLLWEATRKCLNMVLKN